MGKGDFLKTWLHSEANKEDKEVPLRIQPETALVTQRWKDQNSLGVARLSQFPEGGLEGLFDILDQNLTIPSFDNSLSKEGVAITLILYSHFHLEGRWETLFRGFNSQLKKRSIPTLARRLIYLCKLAGTNSLANMVPPCPFKHDYLLPAEAYCHKAFKAYEGMHKAEQIPQAEHKQTEVAKEVLETGADKNERELV